MSHTPEIPRGHIIGRSSGMMAGPVWNYHDHFDAEADKAFFMAMGPRPNTGGIHKRKGVRERLLAEAEDLIEIGWTEREAAMGVGVRPCTLKKWRVDDTSEDRQAA